MDSHSFETLLDDSDIPSSSKRPRRDSNENNYFANLPSIPGLEHDYGIGTSDLSTVLQPPQPPTQVEEKKTKGGKQPLPRGSACLLCRKRKLVRFLSLCAVLYLGGRLWVVMMNRDVMLLDRNALLVRVSPLIGPLDVNR